ncbi:hypothetical protein L6164_003014 [Bauhinia variegata]|uniref:Uncharacterized protein n=1 Tax=Bauhinia variegata TaxID=167791 RepID=A0ACB9PZH5_BAUVA|nr:hypothetical protein L6164_003014 [Bauhinia variegata]
MRNLADHRDLFAKASAKPSKAYGGEDLTFQLIDGNGNFNNEGLKDFARQANLYQSGRSYAVVAIMGPQSSGKSTLLNHLFRTNFKMMDDVEGRSQTTQGIWLARCPDIKPLTLVMDMEGSDGSERGEDDTSFEKQSALFALAVADVVLINMWCQDIGREHAANKPLLRTVFQQVMIQFGNKPRKITLMFVVRDKTKSPENTLEDKLREDIEKLWASVLKPSGSSNLQLRDFFKVEVVFLPNYEEKEQDFKSKVKELKQRFVNSTAPGRLADTREGKEPASGFLISAQNIWNDILGNKDLDLPAHKIMVATARCEEIKNEQYNSFQMNEELHNLRKDAQFGFVPDFGKRVNSILNTCVSNYDEEALNFDEDVVNEKREELIYQSLQLVEPVYQAMVNHLRLKHLEKFMEAFDKGSDGQIKFNTVADHIQYRLNEFDQDCAAIEVDRAKWDSFKARAKLGRHMKSYSATKREDRPAFRVRRLYEPKLKQELSNSVGYLLCEEIDPTWSKIRKHFNTVMDPALCQLDNTLSELGVEEEGRKEMLERLLEYGKDVVGAKAREESGRAKNHMLRKFIKHFNYDDDSSPRNWNNSEEIQKTAEAALSYPLQLLAVLAAIRLEEPEEDDNILKILSSALLEMDQNARIDLDSPTWEMVTPFKTLITPIQCKELWQEFMVEVENAVIDALQLVQPSAYGEMLNKLRQEYLNKFTEEFDKYSDKQHTFITAADDCIKKCLLQFDNHCEDLKIELADRDRLKARAKLEHDMNSYIAAKSEEKMAPKIILFEEKLKQELSDDVGHLLCEETDPTWSKIRKHLSGLSFSRLHDILSEFGIDEAARREKIERTQKYAKDVVINKAREESYRAKNRMIAKFRKLFNYECNSKRHETGDVKIEQAVGATLFTPLKVLAGLVAIRLEESDTDNIEGILFDALSDPRGSNISNALDSSHWNEVPSSRTLLTPLQCSKLLKDYLDEAQKIVDQAREDRKLKKNAWMEKFFKKIGSVIIGIVAACSLLWKLISDRMNQRNSENGKGHKE